MQQNQNIVSILLFLAICISVSASLQVFQQSFIYRSEFGLSELWRWWTAHWVHVGWMHFVLNMLAFLCLPFIFPQIDKRFLVALLLSLPPLISTGFHFLFPDVEAYAGLSGVLHGLYIACAVYGLQFKKERKFALLVIVLVMAKISWENIFGSTQTAELIGSPVLVEAHLLGTIFGVFGALAYMLLRYFQRG